VHTFDARLRSSTSRSRVAVSAWIAGAYLGDCRTSVGQLAGWSGADFGTVRVRNLAHGPSQVQIARAFGPGYLGTKLAPGPKLSHNLPASDQAQTEGLLTNQWSGSSKAGTERRFAPRTWSNRCLSRSLTVPRVLKHYL
jgi:hypothetical protein